MRSKLLALVILVIGFLLAVLGLAWAIVLLLQRQLAQNSGPVAILMITGIILVIIEWKK